MRILAIQNKEQISALSLTYTIFMYHIMVEQPWGESNFIHFPLVSFIYMRLVSSWRPNSSNFSNLKIWHRSLWVSPMYRLKTSAILTTSGCLSPSYDISSSWAWWRKRSCAGFAPRHRTICTIRQSVILSLLRHPPATIYHHTAARAAPRRPAWTPAL